VPSSRVRRALPLTVVRSASWLAPACRITSLVLGSTPSPSSALAASSSGVTEPCTMALPSRPTSTSAFAGAVPTRWCVDVRGAPAQEAGEYRGGY
jgi:hypothetical protein